MALLFRYVHPITEACIESADDFYWRLLSYYQMWHDEPILILYNSLYHMGDVYTYIEDGVHLAISNSLDWEGWQEIGREAGRVFYLLFYKKIDYPWPHVHINYPVEFDDHWETHVSVQY